MTEEKQEEKKPVSPKSTDEGGEEVKESTPAMKAGQAPAKVEDKKEEVEVPSKFKSLVGEIEKMSVLELSELVKVLEEKFGVSAAAPVAVAAAGASAGEAEGKEEQTSFNVELTECGGNKIAVIKALREISDLGLKDAKDLVDAAPKVVKEGVGKEEAEEMKKKLEAAGGKVTLK